MKTAMTAVVGLLCLAACQSPKPGAPAAAAAPKGPVVGGLGTRVAEANATDLRITKDGRFAAYLTDVEKPRLNGAPQYLRVGELFVVGTDGKAAPRRLGQGATNAPGGFLFTADSGRVLYLVGYSAADQAGELRVASLSDAALPSERLGGRVTYFTSGPDSQTVAFVDEGSLKVGPLPSGPFREVATEVTTAVFSPSGSHVYFGRRMALGGGLYQVAVDKGAPTRVADQVGDFHFSSDGKLLAFAARSGAGAPGYDLFITDVTALKPKLIARKVLTFTFAPGDKTVVYTTGDSPQSPGDLFVSKVSGGDATPLGTKVRDFQFSPDGARIAWREHFVGDEGELMVAPADTLKPQAVGHRCQSFAFSPDGRSVAFTKRELKPLVSIDLYLFTEGMEKAVLLKQWVYDYAFRPQGDLVFFRADCVRNGRACNVLSSEVKSPATPPKSVADGVFGFKLADGGERMMLTYARTEKSDLFDVAVLNVAKGERKTLDQLVRLPIFFLDPEGARTAYAMSSDGRGAGVYVASGVP